jgi:hypothetical protein
VKNFTREEATKIAGENPDFLIQDIFEAIDKGNYPVCSETSTNLNGGLFARVNQDLGMRVQQETEAAVTE